MDNQGFTKREVKEGFQEDEAMEVMEFGDEAAATQQQEQPSQPVEREEATGSPMDQGSDSGDARAAIGSNEPGILRSTPK